MQHQPIPSFRVSPVDYSGGLERSLAANNYSSQKYNQYISKPAANDFSYNSRATISYGKYYRR